MRGGDLFLFGIVVLFLLGAAWGGIKVIPQFIESLKLILNVGMVREGERLVFDDIPWKVESLGFRSKLVNSRLNQAEQYLPVRELVGLHSREWSPGETEFPCETGDWVELSDGRTGQIRAQNPSQVVVRHLGGAHTTYPTVEFLSLNPRNLSGESFRVETRFGIDYKHQKDCIEKIPAVMREKLKEKLREIVEEKYILEILVQFAEAGTSSLDYEVQVHLAGEAADDYERVQFALQAILVEACNENEWEIPFAQLTLHQA